MSEKRFSLLLICMSLLSLFAVRSHGQNVAPLTLDDVIPGGKTWQKVHPEAPRVLGVTPHGVLIYKEDHTIVRVNEAGKEESVLTPQEWQKMVQDKDALPPSFFPTKNSNFLISHSGDKVHLLYPDNDTLTTYTLDRKKWTGVDVSPKGDYLVLRDGHNIALLKEGAKEPVMITTDGTIDLVYGESAARNEFGTDRGIFFSPQGRYFAFYRIDRKEVATYPIVRMGRPIARVTPEKYPMAGQASERTTVGIYDTFDGSIKYLETGVPFDRYFTNIAWSPDEKTLFIDEVTRNQENNSLVSYDVNTGKPGKTILSEHNDRYIEPQHPIVFVPGAKGQSFVRLSRKDGFNNLYLYNLSGKLVRQLTKEKYGEVNDFLGIDPDGKYAYYTANAEHPTNLDLYRVSLRSEKVERLTSGEGTHRVMISQDFSYIYDAFSSIDVPGINSVISLRDKKPKTFVLKSTDRPSDLAQRPKVELGSLTSADGKTPLYYKLTTPARIEKGGKYPVIVYVYGGPHAQLVTNSWNSLRYNWDNYMAEQGYIVFTLDNRGSANRGFDFESVIHRNLGRAEMEDQMEGIRFLKTLPYADPDRIGVHGWSFGGFMTTNLILTHPDTFKVGVAGGPVMDWRLYEVMYGERYMDTPDENPSGYEAADLTKRAKDLKGRLLLIHGSVDPVVVWQHSQDFLNAAVEARTLPDYLIYPNHPHNVIGKDRVHLMMHVTRYFEDFLK